MDTKHDFLTPKELSLLYPTCPGRLYKWRQERRGPPYVKFGGRYFYSRAAVEAWLNERTSQNEAA